MGMWIQEILFIFIMINNIYNGNACSMEGVTNWAIPQGATILDTFKGNVFDRAITDIDSITNVVSWEGLNSGPYVTAALVDSRFIIATNDAYEKYEEYETVNTISVTISLRCTSGSTVTLRVVIEIEDTNNNAPRFLPYDELDYTIFTPLPPGSIITGCFDGITVRDIDLTTERIDFTIEENEYFRIDYDADASKAAKEFIGVLKTITFIRSLPEPMTLRIYATDVDRTNDPPLTTIANITIRADTEFELPEEPVFSQPFYFADYNNNQIILIEPISLQNGFDDFVQFSLDGDFSSNFQEIQNGNQILLSVVTPLPANVLRENHIILIVRADREHTSGDSATIIVRLPEEVPLEFERVYYEGKIENNSLEVPTFILTQGYEEVISVEVFGEYRSYFTTNIQRNVITLNMEPLSTSIINENIKISLEIVASSEINIATAVVILDIIKDDNVTPVFNKPIYEGSYTTDSSLILEEIYFEQGYDDSVELSLEGEHRNLFSIVQDGLTLTLSTTGIPPAIFYQQQIILTLQATKPRTVGASAIIFISLPAARHLGFEQSTHRGTLTDNALSLEPIILIAGYDENVVFSLTGEHQSFFRITPIQNQLTITLETPIPENILLQNNLIILTIEASGLNAVPTTASIVLDIIKEDTTTPVFSQNIYNALYQEAAGVIIENISLMQGFADDVTFEIKGDHAEYFNLSHIENNVTVYSTYDIPEEVIYNEKVLVLNVVANKPLTVGANAVLTIRFPSELTEPVVMRFARNTHNAAIENNTLRADPIILSTGYLPGTEFFLSGDNYIPYFDISNAENEVSLSLINELPINEIEDTFIVLEVEARRERAITAWTSIVVDIVKEETHYLDFSKPYYQGIYNEEQEALSIEEISLSHGFDNSVTFELEGDNAELFLLINSANNNPTIVPAAPLNSYVLENNTHILFAIVATKPNANVARAAIYINIERVMPAPRYLRFAQNYYTGFIEDNNLSVDTIILEGYTDEIRYNFIGDYADYFQVTNEEELFTIRLLRDLPTEISASRNALIYTLEAEIEDTRTHTTIILEFIRGVAEDNVISFEEVYYVGSYSHDEGLIFNSYMRVNEELNIPITYSLNGSQSVWFELVSTEKGQLLNLLSVIPEDIIANNNQLVFTTTAESTGYVPAVATIIITLNKENTDISLLGFDRISYTGSIENNVVKLDSITLIQGYTEDVSFSLQGELAEYFDLTPMGAGLVSVTLQASIPDQVILANRLIVLDIQASAPQALSAHAAIVFEVIVDEEVPTLPQLIFDATFYTGSYNDSAGVTLNNPISLAQGYDESVDFVLEGDHAQWFDIVSNGNSITLTVTNTIPPGVLANNPQLVFVIIAQRLGSDAARATVVISVTEKHTGNVILSFDRVTYVGSIQNTTIILDPITLIEGYTDDVSFSLQGELAEYFTLSPLGAGLVSVILPSIVPDQVIPANRLIVLDIRASAPQALSAHATIVFEVIVDEEVPTLPQLIFDATFYTASYNDSAGVTLNNPISLAQGYDESVDFVLEGDHAQWFDIVSNGNSITLTVTNTIPPGVLANNPQFVFVIIAQRLGSDAARATVVISVTEKHTGNVILSFERVTYVGSIKNTTIILDPITLIEGYTDDVSFSLQGELAEYFTLSPLGAGLVSVILPSIVPDQVIPANRLIVLDIRASAPQALSAHATIVFEVIVDEEVPTLPQLIFDATFYTGSYNDSAGVTLNNPISLAQGYDESVDFVLEGDHAQWFDIVSNGNSITLTVTNTIPPGVLANNPQLVFVIIAQRLGSDAARATVVISVTEEHTGNVILSFDRVTYVGSIQNTTIILDPITLIEGYTDDVSFSLQGELAEYFTLSPLGAGLVSVILPSIVPDQVIPANRLIVLDIRASAPQALSAHATIVFEVIVDEEVPTLPQLIFDATFYTASYNDSAGVTLNNPISLAQGYDESVDFVLEGDHAQWFDIVSNGNSITLTVTNTIPPGVLANNPQFVFVIIAQRLGSDAARATVVISVTEKHTGNVILSFERVTYVGSIKNTTIILDPITLIEGYTDDVSFSLQGELAEYFTLSPLGAGLVSVILPSIVPDQVIPANRLIVLDIRASAPQALSAHATIVFEVIVDEEVPTLPQLIFDATFYTGSYNDSAGVTLNNPISLAQGYDESVDFILEGDHAQWFDIVSNGNSITLTVTNTIPPGVLANNPQLVFVIIAQRLGSDAARATVVISVTEEHTGNVILSFDRVTYVGSIQNTTIILDPITLIEGYTDDVSFSLQGELAEYFTLSPLGAGLVSVILPSIVPDQVIPANRLIVLDIRASAPQALSAHATIVFEVIVDEEVPTLPQLIFDATFYTGSYNDSAGVTLNNPISLAQGYDESVDFDLKGDHAQWFVIVQNGNYITLTVTNTIPSGVLANNPQLVFVIIAQRLGSDAARATVVISVTEEHTGNVILSFDRVTYVGSIQNTTIILDPITLIEGYTDDVSFSLQGELAEYFTLSPLGAGLVSVILPSIVPDQVIPANRLIVLDIRASAPQALSAHATIVFEVIVDEEVPTLPQLIFDATFYTGFYNDSAGVTLNNPISLAQGYDESVDFVLEGDHAQWFDIVSNGNSITLTVTNTIPPGVLANNPQLVFVIIAQRLGSDAARATVVISVTEEHTGNVILSFDRVTYVGSIQNTTIILDPITLIEGYTDDVSFSLQGELAEYFTLSPPGAGLVSVILPSIVPDQVIPANRLIVLDIRASAPQALSAHATIVFEVIVDEEVPTLPQLIFDATFYTGSYNDSAGLTLNNPISLAQGYDESVDFVLEGDHAQWFDIVSNDNSITLTVTNTIPPGVLANNPQLVFVIIAQRLGSDAARATVVISVTEEHTGNVILSFDRVTYVGSIQNTTIILDPITLIEGYTDDVSFSLQGELAEYFTLSPLGAGLVNVILPSIVPDQVIPANRLIVLDIRASAPQALSAHATIVFEVIVDEEVPTLPQLIFDATFYTGSYNDSAGVTLNNPISLAQGYDESVDFDLKGDHAQWFVIVQNGNYITLTVTNTIPSGVLANNPQLVFVIIAQRLGSDTARATIVISVSNDLQTSEDVLFDKLVYEGIVQLGVVQHETITIVNYDATTIQLYGEFSSLFEASLMNGVVAVQASGSLNLPDDITQVVLELHAADARAVLLLQAIQTDVPIPTVMFSSSSYVLSVDIVQTGLVGRVLATADNGEAITYSLAIDNVHLQTRVTINNAGELYLSAPANSGVYTFQVIATTVITRAEGMAVVHLTVEALTICGEGEIVVPPLIIIDRDEEEPHRNLVTLDSIQEEACYFTLSNRWPHDQNWLYVDENGLHAKSIDREHETIAFMALSQVQVELILHCENDNVVRSKRSLRTDWLGPYDYGSSKWILTESIPYNSRRSLVNLIVNDINDNTPVFIGKELEPIIVGYPIREIEERILPRSLAELQATDADVGENAALVYWSSEEVLAVAPTTGFVHLRTGAQLENNQRLIVNATDQRGKGLTGNIQLLIKLLDLNNILVVTVKDAFLDDEANILAQLSEAVGYEIKVLRSVVISDDLVQNNDEVSRIQREESSTRASLMLYVYGLVQNEPVLVDRLTTDINSNAVIVNVVNTISLEDHLDLDTVSTDIGFMVATIVLSVLLFIVLVIVAIWFFLRWRKNKNYSKFSGENSLASRSGSVEQFPKQEIPKPRLNIEDLKRSEKRLQDMLSTPVQEITVDSVAPRIEVPGDSLIDFSPPETSNPPIVIQSIDKLKDSDDIEEDEFGEIRGTRRKSVVTFNENVEKIIHVEDNDDDADTISSRSSYEIYKL